MKSPQCEKVQDLLPDWVAEILDDEGATEVREHLLQCPECAGEEKLVRTLFEGRPTGPDGLEARIQSRVREELAESLVQTGVVKAIDSRRRWAWNSTPTWALSAAALVVLSLGVGVIWDGQTPEVTLEPVEVAAEEPMPEAWLWDDGMVAGAPVYDGLTDEELEALIEELEG
jgi:anti-sigma factor RsiW